MPGTAVRARPRRHSRGIRPDTPSVYHATRREPWVALCPAALRPALLLQYEALDALAPVVARCEQQLVQAVEAEPIAKVLMTCPGIGPVRAAQLLTTVIHPGRVRTKRQFWSYSGLGIETHSSSDWVQQQGH